MKNFWLCFVPIFVAVDAIGVLPIYVSLTGSLDMRTRRAVLLQSIITALLAAVIFLIFGPALLRFLGITVADFMIAGGTLLFAMSLSDLITGEKKRRQIEEVTMGAVPIGIPLVAGPALLTTCILLADEYGKLVTGSAMVANILLAGLVFFFADQLTRWIGHNGTRTASKISSLFLAAIGVMLVRKGILEAVASVLK